MLAEQEVFLCVVVSGLEWLFWVLVAFAAGCFCVEVAANCFIVEMADGCFCVRKTICIALIFGKSRKMKEKNTDTIEQYLLYIFV